MKPYTKKASSELKRAFDRQKRHHLTSDGLFACGREKQFFVDPHFYDKPCTRTTGRLVTCKNCQKSLQKQ